MIREILEKLDENKITSIDYIQKLKDGGYYDSFLKLKKSFKKGKVIIMELDNSGKIIGLELIPKTEYDDFSDVSGKNYTETNIIIFESTISESRTDFVLNRLEDIAQSYGGITYEDAMKFIRNAKNSLIKEVENLIFEAEDYGFDIEDKDVQDILDEIIYIVKHKV
jgi:sulfatase maturation enzyme AslB (radical SAM superfamily)